MIRFGLIVSFSSSCQTRIFSWEEWSTLVLFSQQWFPNFSGARNISVLHQAQNLGIGGPLELISRTTTGKNHYGIISLWSDISKIKSWKYIFLKEKIHIFLILNWLFRSIVKRSYYWRDNLRYRYQDRQFLLKYFFVFG